MGEIRGEKIGRCEEEERSEEARRKKVLKMQGTRKIGRCEEGRKI